MPKSLKSNQPLEAEAESVPSSLRIVCDDSATIQLEAADQPFEGEDKPSLRKFNMTAYTGGEMRLGGWPYPVVVDLAGMRVTRKSRPILKDHDRGSIVGINQTARQRWNEEKVIARLQMLSTKHPGETIRQHDSNLAHAAEKRFGTLAKALKAAGVSTKQTRRRAAS